MSTIEIHIDSKRGQDAQELLNWLLSAGIEKRLKDIGGGWISTSFAHRVHATLSLPPAEVPKRKQKTKRP